MTISTPVAAAAAEAAALPPAATTFSTWPALTSKPSTACPALIRLSAMGRPILPSPMKPIRVILVLLPQRLMIPRAARPSLGPVAGGHEGEPHIEQDRHELRHDGRHADAIDLRKEHL